MERTQNKYSTLPINCFKWTHTWKAASHGVTQCGPAHLSRDSSVSSGLWGAKITWLRNWSELLLDRVGGSVKEWMAASPEPWFMSAVQLWIQREALWDILQDHACWLWSDSTPHTCEQWATCQIHLPLRCVKRTLPSKPFGLIQAVSEFPPIHRLKDESPHFSTPILHRWFS